MRKSHWIGLGALGLGAGAVHVLLPGMVERRQNRLLDHEPYRVGEEARRLHASIPVADLHSDALLWRRDLTRRSSRGHVDFPRLREGGVALQVFSSVTHGPSRHAYGQDLERPDLITALAVVQGWPPWAWTSYFRRAMHQARRLRRFQEKSGGQVRWVRTRADLEAVLAERTVGRDTLGAVFGTEGCHALEGDLEKLDRLYGAGLRVLGLHHFIDNELGGSLHGATGGGLTDFGVDVVQAADERGIILDLAHASPRVVRDVLSVSAEPVLLSHGGLRSVCDSPRNLDDDLMVEVAARGGLVGIGYWDAAVCDITPEGVVHSIRHAIDLLGVDHVALGSDYDGTVQVAFDASELAVLTQTMIAEDFSEEEIRKVMGRNAVAFVLEDLPR